VLADIIKKPLEKEAFFIFITHPQPPPSREGARVCFLARFPSPTATRSPFVFYNKDL